MVRGYKSGKNQDKVYAKGEKMSKESTLMAGKLDNGLGHNLGSNKDKGAAKGGRNKSLSFGQGKNWTTEASGQGSEYLYLQGHKVLISVCLFVCLIVWVFGDLSITMEMFLAWSKNCKLSKISSFINLIRVLENNKISRVNL